MDFPSKEAKNNKNGIDAPTSAKEFEAWAKDKHNAVFAEYLEKARDDEFSDFEEYSKALADASWNVTWLISRASWKNSKIAAQRQRS